LLSGYEETFNQHNKNVSAVNHLHVGSPQDTSNFKWILKRLAIAEAAGVKLVWICVSLWPELYYRRKLQAFCVDLFCWESENHRKW